MAERAVIFDLDGTVWDSWPFYAFVLAQTTGRPLDDLIGALRNGESIAKLHKSLRISRNRFVDQTIRYTDQLQLYEDVSDVLRRLKKTGYALGVVTSLPETIASPLLVQKGLCQFFDLAIFARFGQPPKPHPGGLNVCLQRLGIAEPRDALYVGDAINDAQAARAAGTRFAWASYGYGDGPIEYDLLLERPADLLRE